MKLKTISLAAAAMAAAVLTVTPAAHAVDGVILITQATANMGLPGCPNDGASLITICRAGSYRLGGDLVANGLNGIDITADGVTLDLNGFTITQPASGTRAGIDSANRGVSIANGTVAGFATDVSLRGSGETLTGVRALDAGVVNINIVSGTILNSFALGGINGIEIGEGMIENSIVQGGSGFGIEFRSGGLAKNNLLSNAGTCLVGTDPVRVVDNTFDSACHSALHLAGGGVYTGNTFDGVGQVGIGGTNGGQNLEFNIGSGGQSVGWDLTQNKNS